MFRADRGGGVVLRACFWPAPAAAPARGTVFLIQGRTEYLEKYFETARDLLARGFSVLSWDWRGQGGSSRPLPDALLGHVDDFADFTGDLGAMVQTAENRKYPRPYVILAHSMGGAIALLYLHDNPGKIDKAVLSAPMIRVRTKPFSPRVAQGIAAMGARLGLARSAVPTGMTKHPAEEMFEEQAVTSDYARFVRNVTVLGAERSLGLARPTYGWLAAAYRAMAKLDEPDYCSLIQTPILIVSAGQDQIVDPQADVDLRRRLPRCQRVIIHEAQHEILQENDDVRARFFEAFDAFATP